MPTALEEGRYHSKGLRLQCQLHCGSATGLPAPSAWASAASSSAVITRVKCSRNSGPYSRQVATGDFTSACPTGKNISDGLRHTWTIQFAAAHSSATTAKTAAIRAQPGIDWNRRYARLTRLALERTRAGRARVRFMILGYPIRVESLQRGFHARERRQHGQARRGPEAGD